MKRRSLFVLTFFIPFLFTSCLASLLNEKFNLKTPVSITYVTSKGQAPQPKKFPSSTALTNQELPVLTEPGWKMDGWYLDSSFTKKATAGTQLSENTTLYAKWIANTNTTFTINNYFLNPRKGFTNFTFLPEYTQNLTGSTGDIINQESYSLVDLYPDNTELQAYELVYYPDESFDNTTINADGSTVVNNYYYLNKIYDYEFEQIYSRLPDSRWCYWFLFFQSDTDNSFDFYKLKTTISNNSYTLNTYYDENTQRTKKWYNKHVTLNLGYLSVPEIPAYEFSYTDAIYQIHLPGSCTKIGSGAFYNCHDLDNLYTNNRDTSKTWKYIDSYGNEIDLGTNPNSQTFANLVRNTYFEFYYN